MRRVAFLLHAASSHQISGGEKSLVELAAGSARAGIDSLVVGPRPGRSMERARAAGVEAVVRKCRMLWLSHPTRMPVWEAVLRTLIFLAGWPALFRLRSLLRARRTSLVHVNGIVHVWGALAARSAGIPVVWHVREIVGGKIRRRLLTRLAVRLADRILAVSAAVADQFGSAQDKVEVVYNGISGGDGTSTRNRPRSPDSPVRIGHAGQILPHKGQEEFIQAAECLVGSKDHPVEFLVAGACPRGGTLEHLRGRIRDRGLAGHVKLTGFIPDLRSFLSSLDILAVTSTAPDPLPRVLAEGMMEGVPAVAFATGGIPEMVQEGKTGFLVRPGDLEGLANALRLLIEDPDLRRRMGAAARSRAVELFSMGSYIRRCIGVYDDIWTSRGGRGKSAA